MGKAPRSKSAAKTHKRILVASGVNLDLLGERQPEIYGKANLTAMAELLGAVAAEVGGVALSFFQSNNEAEYLAKISAGWDGAVLNPGAWTHTSLALADRLAGLKLPFVEVHLSNIAAREPVRQKSYAAALAVGVVYGFGIDSYALGLRGLLQWLERASGQS